MAGGVRDLVRRHPVAALALLALVLELTIFNLGFWTTRGLTPRILSAEETTVTSPTQALAFEGIGTRIFTVTVRLSQQGTDKLVRVTYTVTDTGSQAASYVAGTAEEQRDIVASQTQNLHVYGSLESLSVTFPDASAQNPVIVTGVILDEGHAFSLNVGRFAFVLGLFLLAWAFRRGSGVWTTPALGIGRMPRLARRITVTAVSVACIAVVACFPNLVQLASSTYNSGVWDGSSLVNQALPAWYHGYANDEYTELARSLSKGQLWLDDTPPAWLTQMSNPYDWSQREALAKSTGQGYKHDAAYFGGHYYVYFGVVPVVAMYLPYHLVTGGDLPNFVAVLVPSVLFCVGLMRLLEELMRERFRRASLGTLLLVYLGVILASGLLIGVGRATMYNVPVAFARALVVWGLYLWLRGYGQERRRAAVCGCVVDARDLRSGLPALAGGSLCVALVAGCRPQLLVAGVFLLPLLVWAWRRGRMGGDGRDNRGRRISALAALLVPFVLVAAGLMWYDAARFGSPFDLGANYNLATNDMTIRGNVPERLVDGLFFYLFQAPHVSAAFPFLLPADATTSYLGLTISEPMMGGALACYAFLWAPVPLLWHRVRCELDRPIRLAVATLLVCGVVVAAVDAEGAGILGRYYQDFLPFLALASALVLLGMLDRRPAGSRWETALRVTFGLTVGYEVLLFLFMCGSAGIYTSGEAAPAVWEYLRTSLQFWT